MEHLGYWSLSRRLRAEVLADAIIDLLPLLLVFFALPLAYHALKPLTYV